MNKKHSFLKPHFAINNVAMITARSQAAHMSRKDSPDSAQAGLQENFWQLDKRQLSSEIRGMASNPRKGVISLASEKTDI